VHIPVERIKFLTDLLLSNLSDREYSVKKTHLPLIVQPVPDAFYVTPHHILEHHLAKNVDQIASEPPPNTILP